MTRPSTIRAAIAARIATVPAAGHVHSFERYAKNDRQLIELFSWPGDDPRRNHLRGWQIRQQSRSEKALTYPERSLVVFGWRIVALMAHIDEWETGIHFDDMLEDVAEAFRRDRTLGGLLDDGRAENQNGVQMTSSGGSMVAGKLCHVAELRLDTAVYMDATPAGAIDDYLTTETAFSLPPLSDAERLPAATDNQNMRAEENP